MTDLLPFCNSDRQRQMVLAVIEHGSQRKAAEALGLNPSAVDHTINRLKVRRTEAAIKTGPMSIFVLPDVQAKANVPLDHLDWAGRYAAKHKPDAIVCIGDFADMPSLSLYDRGKKSFEGRRYKADVEATHHAMERFMSPIVAVKNYTPLKVLTLGNHEHRINRACEDDVKLDGTMSVDDLGYKAWGWEVVPFLEVREIAGIQFSHYFYNPNSGRPFGGTCHNKLKNVGLSFVMGHQQGFDTASRELPNGRKQTGVVAGSFYLHKEDYKGPQGNGHWQGCLMFEGARDGEYDIHQLSLDYLKRKFG